MPPALFLYAVLMLIAVIGLWGAYRLLGTPSRLDPGDYATVLDDLLAAVTRAASQLRDALEGSENGSAVEEVAAASRKIFQTGYYQVLRLRPSGGPDLGDAPRRALRQACEAYEWASRMATRESLANPAVREAVLRLMDAGDREVERAGVSLASIKQPPGRTAP